MVEPVTAAALLVEIGVEEMPASAVSSAIDQLKNILPEKLAASRLTYGAIYVTATPRRFVFHIESVPSRQAEAESMNRGPAVRAAFEKFENVKAGASSSEITESGMTKALEGFMRSQGITIENIVIQNDGGNDYVYAHKQLSSSSAVEVLPELISDVISGLHFSRLMSFDKNIKFIRPLRWIMAIYGDTALNVKVGDIASGNVTYGHRFLAPEAISIQNADLPTYIQVLTKAFVIADIDQRRDLIVKGLEQTASAIGATYDSDEDVLSEVVNLVEYPTVITGEFEEEFLAVPSAVSVKVMKSHQRYFPMYKDGKLIRSFGVVHNVLPDASDVVKKGHERVVRARLADGKFFFEEDLKRPVDHYLEKLKKVVYQDKLGTVFDKCERISLTAVAIAERVGCADVDLADLRAAAFLAKADLATDMVYEFPELQGYMGSVYADRVWCAKGLLRGKALHDPAGVVAASREHYLPKFNGDELPSTDIGNLISVADKLDSIIGIIGIGSKPSGSEDPFGLRRQMSGIIQIALHSDWDLGLNELMEIGKQSYGETGRAAICEDPGLSADLDDLIDGRYRFLLKEKSIGQDIVDAVLPVWRQRPFMVLAASHALSEMQTSASDAALLADAVSSAIRVRNLSNRAFGTIPNEDLLKENAERALHTAFFASAKRIEELRTASLSDNVEKDAAASVLLKRTIAELSTLRSTVDAFFDGVLVNDPDPKIKENRLRLLNTLDELFLTVADLTKVSVADVTLPDTRV